MITIELQSDSVKFLEQLRPGGPWVLTAIIPDGPTTTKTVHTAEQVDAFVREHNGFKNLYYTLNPTKTDMSKKPNKSDIASAEFVHADLDPNEDETSESAKERYLAKLGTLHKKATVIVDSGNGIQALWKLLAAIGEARFTEVEACSKTIMLALGAKPGTQNIDRLLRLPGTINLPNRAKRDKGRAQCEAKLIQFNGASYPLDELPKPTRQEQGQQRRGRKREVPAALKNMLFLQGDKPADYPSRSELFFAFINAALRGGIDEDFIVELCVDRSYAGYSIFQHVSDNGGETYVKKQIERIVNEPAQAQGEKLILRLTDGQLDKHWRTVEDELIKRKLPVYVRAGKLVVPLWYWEDTGYGDNKQKQVLSCKLVKYIWPQLADMVQHHAVTCQKFNKTMNRWRNVDPPKDLIERLLLAGHYNLPIVGGIVTAPTMRWDGTLITEPGYDAKTQLWYKPAGGIELPSILERPSKGQAEEALQLLNELFDECAFVDQRDRSVALAGAMTVVLRGAFKVAPIIFISKPEPGTGGSYLVQIISTLALGREAVPLKVSADPKELEKELSAAAYEASPIININNLTFDLESALLSQLVTEGAANIRVFGKNTETVKCDCRATTVLVNGNNVSVVDDLTRRVIDCRLDARMERPETKVFKHDPIAKIKSDRGKYLAAVFTIAKAFMNSNAKIDVDVINGFEGWTKFVRQPLIWLGAGDPMESQKHARERDPARAALKERFTAIVKYIGADKDFDAAKVLELGNERSDKGLKYPGLNSAFECYKNSARSIGRQLSRDLNRQANDHRLELAGTGRSGNTYCLRSLAAPATAEAAPETAAPAPEVAQNEEDFPF